MRVSVSYLSLIRFFAIIRLIITIIATGFIFIQYPSVEELNNLAEFEQKKYKDESSYHLYIEQMLKFQKIEIDKQQNDQFWRSREIIRFQLKFGINSINILITALIWARAFANKKNCLPIYAILEDEDHFFQYAAFVSAINGAITLILWEGAFSDKRHYLSLYLLLETPLIVWGIHRASTNAPQEKADLYATISIVLIGCFVVVVVILGKRYMILKRRDRDARMLSL
ncbi:hypothetical protein PRIPAC_88724 [Pristionchus pacificus]|uniref:Uncharacterized protein n=1 Tax=Pristionchus pacificus TaxID=54126 RepID=A0A2A6B917_PRIPA|nr:hypothetical protein PRIPAC_88724 [Pristionchus pacificus]|eukprot:PDM62353.1 hypothetical protein PRIPAC_51795 [Pristionchus pacificus]